MVLPVNTVEGNGLKSFLGFTLSFTNLQIYELSCFCWRKSQCEYNLFLNYFFIEDGKYMINIFNVASYKYQKNDFLKNKNNYLN